MAERIIGGEEEPAVAAALGDLLRGAGRERMGVEHPLHGVGRAELAVEIRRAGRMGDEQLLLLVGDVLHREPDGRDRHVDDQVDLVAVVPFPGDAGGDIGLDLVVGGDTAIGLPGTVPPKSSTAICAAATDPAPVGVCRRARRDR